VYKNGRMGGIMALKILCDFDGTITKGDTAEAIFSRFAAPVWRDIEARWEAGEMGSAECMRRQIELLDASLPELDQALDALEIDPSFTAFNEFCKAMGIELVILSDGVDYFIRRILQRAGLERLHVRANGLVRLDERRFTLTHPHRVMDCASGAGTCKCALAAAQRGHLTTIFIGDGRSDFCVAHEADIVFAKNRLLRYTREQGIAAISYTTFSDVQATLDTVVTTRQQHHRLIRAGLNI
jgi:2-hydroxy-3-keto-5-methylthiopentenyl-1-phosphate phosphatase